MLVALSLRRPDAGDRSRTRGQRLREGARANEGRKVDAARLRDIAEQVDAEFWWLERNWDKGIEETRDHAGSARHDLRGVGRAIAGMFDDGAFFEVAVKPPLRVMLNLMGAAPRDA